MRKFTVFLNGTASDVNISAQTVSELIDLSDEEFESVIDLPFGREVKIENSDVNIVILRIH